MTVRCSDVTVESLPGTAKQGRGLVLFERLGGWGHDVLDGTALGQETAAALKKQVESVGYGFQFIRKPEIHSFLRDAPSVYVVRFAPSPRIVRTTVTCAEDILDIDLADPQGVEVTQPMGLVCTHGKRDMCCAIKGRPLAKALDDRLGGEAIWETSHNKGHRFAPVFQLLPWGYSYGRLNVEAAYAALTSPTLFVPQLRGRSIYGPAEQVAEVAIASQVPIAPGELELVDARGDRVCFRGRSGRYLVRLEQVHREGVVASCGKPGKAADQWVASGDGVVFLDGGADGGDGVGAVNEG
mgnify:CR=1 FL=1